MFLRAHSKEISAMSLTELGFAKTLKSAIKISINMSSKISHQIISVLNSYYTVSSEAKVILKWNNWECQLNSIELKWHKMPQLFLLDTNEIKWRSLLLLRCFFREKHPVIWEISITSQTVLRLEKTPKSAIKYQSSLNKLWAMLSTLILQSTLQTNFRNKMTEEQLCLLSYKRATSKQYSMGFITYMTYTF